MKFAVFFLDLKEEAVFKSAEMVKRWTNMNPLA
jgi:hypothetical protein